MALSRYSRLKYNGEPLSLPKIKISKRETDIYSTYNPNLNRLDRMAADVYGDDTLYWLLLIANPQYYMEFDIPAGSVIRIPSPINSVMIEVEQQIINGTNSV